MRSFRAASALAFVAFLLPAALAAQGGDTLHTVRVPMTDSALRIPADRASDLVAWAPGGGLDESGAPTWHGHSVARGEWTIDGVRWASGLRSTGFFGLGPAPTRLEPGLNTLAGASLAPSALSPVTFDLTTLHAGDHWVAHGSTETGAPFRPDGGTGDSRLEVGAGGPVGGGFRLQIGGTVSARQAASGGVGYANAPYYLATSIDTTVRFEQAPLDTVEVPIQRYTATDKVPYTPRGTTDWTARIDGRIGTAAAWAHWVGTRQAEGLFRYTDAFNPGQITGRDQGASDIAAGVDLPLVGRVLRVATAVQHERSEEGPLTYAAQLDSRQPGLGLLAGGLDLRWDMGNFPIDDQLVTNYRLDTPGSRQSPYDLQNPDQYRLIDEYRNSPYATFGWSEGGGPVGRLRFYDDQRFVASATLVQDRVLGGSTSAGVEFIRHDAKMYAFDLTSQANSNVWIEHPEELALTLDWAYHALGWSVDAGVRVDRFNSNGRRPYDRVTDPAEADYGKYVWFPRGASMSAIADSLVHWVPDEAHTAAAPHAMFALGIAPGWDGRIRFQRSATLPDFADLYDGINTDLSITNISATFGRDVGHEITDHVEAALTHRHGSFQGELSYFEDHYKQVVTTQLGQFYDPLKKQLNDIFTHPMTVGPTIKGATLSAGAEVTSHFGLTGAYTYLSAPEKDFFYGFLTQEESPLRRHTLVATAHLNGSDQGIARGLGAIVTLRLMSGLAQVADTTDDLSAEAIPVRSHGIPAWKSIDLRLAKGGTIGGHHVTAYVDARNLLNAENLRRAFASGDPHGAVGVPEGAWRFDSASYATEANRNGLYLPDGTIDLTFGGAGRGGCGSWYGSNGVINPPDCAYLIAAEERFGNGDGLYTIGEQQAASASYFMTVAGPGAFNGPPRAFRAGIELSF